MLGVVLTPMGKKAAKGPMPPNPHTESPTGLTSA